MGPERATGVPTPAFVLGWLGVTPFVGSAAAIAAGWPPGAAALPILVFYGAVILSFMGGVQWGFGLHSSSDPADLSMRLAISVLPAIAAWISLAWLPVLAATSVLAAAFVVLLAYDMATVRRGLAPAWYTRLRAPLTAVVIVCLLVPMAVSLSR